jgi:fibronectin-binding autotransporter adhesin
VLLFHLFNSNHSIMKSSIKSMRLLIGMSLICATSRLAYAQSSWTGGDLPNNNLNWSDANNWSGGVPANDVVTFPNGAFPVTTNTQNAVNNIVQSSMQISSLIYNNVLPNYDTTLIPSGSILTVSGGLTVSDNANITSVAIMGGGSLIAGTGGTGTILEETTGNGALLLDLSGLTNFVFNFGATSPGNLQIANAQAPGGGSQTMNLAAVSNNITAASLNLGDNNTRGVVTFNLGNGTNILNADTINLGVSKTQSTMQFIGNAGGGLAIANHTGTGRATINMGTEASTGSTGSVSTGNMFFDGGTVNILAGTLTMANRAARADSPGALANLEFNSGIVDATTINMAINTSGGGYPTANLSVGNSGILKIGTGGMSMANQGGTAGTSALTITNGGTVICSNNIYKTTSEGTATITISDGDLNMASIAGTIGVADGNAIDNLDVTNSVLTLPAASTADVVVTTLNPDTATTTTINIGYLPSIPSYPATFPLITYTTGGGNLATGGILPNIALGTLPNTFGTFTGFLSNDVSTATIWLVITGGPSVSAVQWGGGVNNHWDTNSSDLNWTNNGAAIKYSDGDDVTFSDQAQTTTVNLTRTNKPATLTFNNSVLNYNLTGIGAISGPVQLVVNGGATNTLAESGGDNFSLGIQINNGGTVILDDPNSSISGGVTINGGATLQIGNNDANGTLPGGTLDDEGTLVYDRSGSVNLSVAIPGGGALTQSGSGTLTLSVSNSYSGNTTINAGTLALTNSGSVFDSAQVSAFTGTTFDVSGASGVTTLNTLNLSNAILNVEVGYLQTNLIVSGGLNMYGTANTINVKSLPAIAYYPAVITLLYASSGISGYNFVLGTLPAGGYSGSIIETNGDAVALVLSSGPVGTRPLVTWSGADFLDNVSTNWSDAQNWQTPGVPAAAEPVTFNNTAAVGGSALSTPGGGISDLVPANIDNIVDVSLTNAALSYANSSSGSGYHNTQIASGKTLTVNGSLTINGSGGNVAILGTNAILKVNNPNNSTVINVEATTAPTLDMSGLDTFNATVNQIGVGFDTASAGSSVNGIWYLAKTNRITTGVGNFSTSSALVVGGGSGATAGNGQLYLGQTNSLYVDGITLGVSTSTGDLIEFNPALTGNPVAYIRGISGDSSRVTLWSMGDDSININNGQSGSGIINDFSAGTLNALVNTLIVGQGAQGNELQTAVKATFNMGAGNLDVTTLNIGVGDNGKTGGTGIGVMNVTGGTLVANSVTLGTGGVTTTAGTLNLTNATLVVSNGISIGTGTDGGTLDDEFSTVKILNSGTIGLSGAPLTTLVLDGGTFQLNVDGNNAVANNNVAAIVATTVNTAATTTINIGTVANVGSTVQIPLISYTGTDPYSALSLGTYPAGYAATLVDDTANSSVDLSIVSTVAPTPHITGISISGHTLTISATNGADSGTYTLLESTNLLLPIPQWKPVFTNSFNANGTLNLSTNVVTPGTPDEFYLLEEP